jgi:hypothetical protein
MAVGLFNPMLRMQQDLDVFLRLARCGTSKFVRSVEVDYRLHGANASRDYRRSIEELLLVYEIHEREARSARDRRSLDALTAGRRRVRRTYSYQAFDAARAAVHDGRTTEAAAALAHSLRLAPSVVLRSTATWARAHALRRRG